MARTAAGPVAAAAIVLLLCTVGGKASSRSGMAGVEMGEVGEEQLPQGWSLKGREVKIVEEQEAGVEGREEGEEEKQEDREQGVHLGRGRVALEVVKGVAIGVVVMTALMLAFPVVAVCVVRALGFTAQGIVAGSYAAFIMSMYAGQVAVGSICAICQAIGALGLGAFAVCGPVLVITAVVAVVVIAIGGLVYFIWAHSALLNRLLCDTTAIHWTSRVWNTTCSSP